MSGSEKWISWRSIASVVFLACVGLILGKRMFSLIKFFLIHTHLQCTQDAQSSLLFWSWWWWETQENYFFALGNFYKLPGLLVVGGAAAALSWLRRRTIKFEERLYVRPFDDDADDVWEDDDEEGRGCGIEFCYNMQDDGNILLLLWEKDFSEMTSSSRLLFGWLCENVHGRINWVSLAQ
jgi:hypothetical protein